MFWHYNPTSRFLTLGNNCVRVKRCMSRVVHHGIISNEEEGPLSTPPWRANDVNYINTQSCYAAKRRWSEPLACVGVRRGQAASCSPLPPTSSPHQSYDENRSRECVLTSSSGQYIYLNSIRLKVSVSNYLSLLINTCLHICFYFFDFACVYVRGEFGAVVYSFRRQIQWIRQNTIDKVLSVRREHF